LDYPGGQISEGPLCAANGRSLIRYYGIALWVSFAMQALQTSGLAGACSVD
jgi:hypothetical protein